MSPANAAYSAPELKHQLLDSKAKALFTCVPLLPTALEAASAAGLPKERIYIIDALPGGEKAPAQYKTLSQLVETGKSLPKLEKVNWRAGEAVRRTAFLCYSSGTSGLPVSEPRRQPWTELTWSAERSNDFPPQCYLQRPTSDSV